MIERDADPQHEDEATSPQPADASHADGSTSSQPAAPSHAGEPLASPNVLAFIPIDPADPPLDPAPAARRRPGLVALLWAYRSLTGLLVMLPMAAAVGAATAQYPRAQAELFDPGGVMLLESLRLSRRAMPAAGWSGGAIAILAAALGLIPLAALIAGLGRAGRVSASFLAGRVSAHAGTLALLYGIGAAAQAVLAVILSMLGNKIIFAAGLRPPSQHLAYFALAGVVLLAISIVGVIRDLGYVAAVHGGHRFYVAASRAVRTFLRRPVRATFAWGSRAVLAVTALALAVSLAPAPAGSAMVAAGFLLHQLALAGAAFARASWLAAAIRLFDEKV